MSARKHIAASLFILALTVTIAAQEQRYANYSVGKYGTKGFEYISFSDQGEIIYSYINEEKNIKLDYLGSSTWKGSRAFKVQFPNGIILNVIPIGLNLKVVGDDGKYLKIFRWHYEGPVNGIGTACMVCADDEKEAMRIIKKNFMK
ncbi:MAG: hypothetical protein WBP93_18355 [Pyrinomonadaceae bacterium]